MRQGKEKIRWKDVKIATTEEQSMRGNECKEISRKGVTPTKHNKATHGRSQDEC